MTEQMGATTKEAKAAGLAQKAFAGGFKGLSAKNIAKAEKALADLSPEQLEAISKANVVKKSNSLLAFTFFYSIGIYILLLSFYFWQIRTDIKPEK